MTFDRLYQLLKENCPEYAEYKGINMNWKDEDAMTFGISAGKIYIAGHDDIDENTDRSTMTHWFLADMYGLGGGRQDFDFCGRAYLRNDVLFIIYWDIPSDSDLKYEDELIKQLSQKYDTEPTKVMISAEGGDFQEKGKPTTLASHIQKQIHDLEQQLHLADPATKPFLRKGLNAMRRKLELGQ